MARLLKCEDIGVECDYICADSEEDLFNKAVQYAKMDERSFEIPNEFHDRVVSLSRSIEHC